MAEQETKQADTYPDAEEVVVDLRDPTWAAILAWIWPGAGHIYQRRYAKGMIYMVCILGTFFYGLVLSGGHAVYASWRPNDQRWQYFCQLGVGAPAFPAIAQAIQVKDPRREPFMITHRLNPFTMTEDITGVPPENVIKMGFMAPPPGPVRPDRRDPLAFLHEKYKHDFDMGTLFTVVAGLLNVLAIYDAFAGPAFPVSEKEEDDEEGEDDG